MQRDIKDLLKKYSIDIECLYSEKVIQCISFIILDVALKIKDVTEHTLTTEEKKRLQCVFRVEIDQQLYLR